MKRFTPIAKGYFALQALLVYCWLTVLSPLAVTDTYYSVYLLCAVFGILCLYDNQTSRMYCNERHRAVLGLCAVLFSGAVALANYPLFEPLSVLQNVFDLACVLGGGWVVGYQILLCLMHRLPLEGRCGVRKYPALVFGAVFAGIAAINLTYLLLALYPGVLTTDSYATLGQIMGIGSYDNVMPFWHTIMVQPFIKAGLSVFGDMNAAIALFHGAQILFMAGCFGYAIMTLYQMGLPRGLLLAVFAVYGLLPHNIVYSVTLWKDIPFAGAAVLLVTALYRLLKNLGSHRWMDWGMFVVGAMGFSLWRTNGWYAFLVLTLLMVALSGRRHRKLLVLMLVILVLCWAMIGPLLDVLGVQGTNFVEAFGIPMQQIARVLHYGGNVSDADMEMLSQIFLVDRTAELYDPYTVDPVKFYTFRYDQVPYLMDHLGEYIGLYLRLGAQNPEEYLKAWVEQTKGYWNGGYKFWTYTLKTGKNDFGIVQTPGENLVAKLFAAWFRYVEKPEILQCFISIGLHVWTLGACAIVNGLKKREEGLLTVPILVLIAGLWLGTPVFAEFRYAYPMILTMPVILATTVFEPKDT